MAGVCVAGGMHGTGMRGGGICMEGVCVAGGMHDRGCVWQEGCVTEGMRGGGGGGGGLCMAGGQARQETRPLQRTVRILLESILVGKFIVLLKVPLVKSLRKLYQHMF